MTPANAARTSRYLMSIAKNTSGDNDLASAYDTVHGAEFRMLNGQL